MVIIVARINRAKILIALLFSIALSCSFTACGGFVDPAPPASPDALVILETPTADAPLPMYNGLGLVPLNSYSAAFEIRFDGDEQWTYLLKMRADGDLDEYRLHIEGGETILNPGDIRFVTDGQTNWMIDSSEDDRCFQFPNELYLGPVFLTPNDILEPDVVRSNIEYVGDEMVLNMQTSHFVARTDSLETWQDAHLDIWMVKSNAATMRFVFSGRGQDPFFDSGMGTIAVDFKVTDVGEPAIEPVVGCEIDLPIPDNVRDLVKMPGLLSFEYSATLEEAVDFYDTAMQEAGWASMLEMQRSDDAIFLSYQREDEVVEINIVNGPNGVRVEILNR